MITNKTNIHHYNNAREQGTVFAFDLSDSAGEMRITAFNNDCSRLHSIIEIGQVFFDVLLFSFVNTKNPISMYLPRHIM